MRSKLLSLCLVLLLLAGLPLQASAQEFNPDQRGSISVRLVSPEPVQPMVGAELAIYYVATVGVNDNGNLFYSFTGEFAECEFSLEDADLESKLNGFVTEHSLTGQKVITDAQGQARWNDLPLGLYFVVQTGEVEDFAPCAPFLVTVPMKTDTGYQYDVNATPKTDVIKLVDITIKKVWNVGSNIEIPDSVTVQLLRDEEVLETAILDEDVNWQVTYEDLPEHDGYSIEEVNVPQGFVATYSREGYVFTVTNTKALAQTGQLIWPIPVFAFAGIIFLMLGFVILRKPGKRDA